MSNHVEHITMLDSSVVIQNLYISMIQKMNDISERMNVILHNADFKSERDNRPVRWRGGWMLYFDTSKANELLKTFLDREGVEIVNIRVDQDESDEVHYWTVRFPFDATLVWELELRFFESESHAEVWFYRMICKSLKNHQFSVDIKGGPLMELDGDECVEHVHLPIEYMEDNECDAWERSTISYLTKIFAQN